ncbi:hypothetical protein ACLOJK_023445 [Asimina triloba]
MVTRPSRVGFSADTTYAVLISKKYGQRRVDRQETWLKPCRLPECGFWDNELVYVENYPGNGGRWLDPGAAMGSGIIEDSFRVGALVESRNVGRRGVSLLVSCRQTPRADDPTRPAT